MTNINRVNALPPLPKSRYRLGVESDGYSQARLLSDDAYTEEDMTTFAEQARADLLADAERLAYLYSRNQTNSNALVDLEVKHFSGKDIGLEEIRAAIDAAMKEKP